MKYSANTTALSSADAILLAIFEQGELSNIAKQFDHCSEISSLIKCDEISGKIGQISLLRQNGH